MKIRPIEMSDFPQWLPLWIANNRGEHNEEITTDLWGKIIDPDFPIGALVAEDKGALVGMVQYVIHPVTGALKPACYMQDLFVPPEHRRKGIARKLVQKLNAQMNKEGWGRLYWVADNKNEAAQKFYENFGVKIDFSFHVKLAD